VRSGYFKGVLLKRCDKCFNWYGKALVHVDPSGMICLCFRCVELENYKINWEIKYTKAEIRRIDTRVYGGYRIGNCNACNERMRLEKHHRSYSVPGDFVWICNYCHKMLHAGYKVNVCCEGYTKT
jgi:hypothetical protein